MVQINTLKVSESLLDLITDTENLLHSESFDGNLPILGDGLQEQIDSILSPVSNLRQDIENTFNSDLLIEAQVLADRLSQIEGVDATVISEQDDDVEFSLKYSGQTNLDFAVKSNLGLSGLDFNGFNGNVAADVNYTFPEVRFGLENGDGFARSTNDFLNLEFDLQPFSSFSGEIGFLEVDLTPISDLDFDFRVDLENSSSAIDFGTDNLTLFEFDLSSGSQLPSISGALDFDTTAIEAAYNENQLSLPFSINDVAIDANSFVNDFLTTKFVTPIQNAIAPIIDELSFLKEPIEILNNVSNESIKSELIKYLDRGSGDGIITLLDLIGIAAETQGIDLDTRLIEQGISLVDDISSIAVSAGEVNLGSIDFRPENIAGEDLADEAVVSSLTDNSLVTTMPDNLGSFNIPLLETPGDAVLDLLLGRDTELINYTLPEFQFQGTIGETFPVYPPLGVFVGGAFNLATNLEFGIDTFGLRQGNLEDGFFFVDNELPEVTTNIGPAVGVGLQFGAGSVQVYQGFTGGVNLNLKDPDGDRKIRLNEIDFNDPLSIFESEPNLGLTLGGSIRLLGATLFSEEAGTSFSPEELEAEVKEIWADVKTILDNTNVFNDPKKFLNPETYKLPSLLPFNLDPTAPNSPLGEAFANLDPFNSNSLLRKEVEKIGGVLDEGLDEIEEGLQTVRRTVEDALENLTVKNIQEQGQTAVEQGQKFINDVGDGLKDAYDSGNEIIASGFNKLKSASGLFLIGTTPTNTNFFDDLKNTTSNLLSISAEVNSNDGLALIGQETLLKAEKDLLRQQVEQAEKNAQQQARELILDNDLLLEGAELESNELYSGNGNDTLRGGILRDNLLSGGGDDLLEGESDDDYLNAGTGDDSLNGGFGNDTLIGGAGNDTLEAGIGNNSLFGEDGDDALVANLDGENELFGGGGDDTLLAGRKSDTLYGGDGHDTLTTASDVVGNDSMLGGAGNDFIFAGAGDDTLIGGEGDDTLRGGEDNDRLDGGDGNDSLAGEAGNDFLVGNGGSDRIYGGDGIDTVSYESSSNDSDTGISIALDGGTLGFDGIDSFDLIETDVENVIGSKYSDRIDGNNLANLIEGEAGDDNLRGLGGNDTFFGGLGADTINGGDGIDTAFYNFSLEGVSIDLLTGISQHGEAKGDRLESIEVIVGSNQNDTLIGDNADNVLNGFGGRDSLVGNGGNDELIGGDGEDLLEGGRGNDTIDGGAGTDTVSYQSLKNDADDGASIVLDNSGVLSTSSDGLDLIQNVENVIGSQYGDSIVGSNIANLIEGEAGDDNLRGLAGNDTFFGGLGADTIDGGDGIDTAFYNFSTEGVSIDLLTGISQHGEAKGDRLESVEIIVGSNQNDTLIGDNADNVLNGFGGRDSLVGNGGNDELIGSDGDDFIEGGAGNDTIDGGAGTDTVSYQSLENDSSTGIVIVLDSLITNSDGAGGIDTIQNIENVTGSQYEDRIIGHSFANVIRGEAGNDTLEGDSGNDLIYGGDGDDRLYGDLNDDIMFGIEIENNLGLEEDSPIVSVAAGIFEDTLFGGAGADYLDGGNGNDRLYGDDGDDTLISKNGWDTLQGGAGNDIYQLSASGYSGVVIEDIEGNDTLTIDIELVLAEPDNDIAGLIRDDTNLIIDINRDGAIDSQNDLTIVNFFDELVVEAGDGFIENLSNLSGTDVVNFF